ncbi:hypothetical protein QBC47DRAFT_16926 [Echria macrotheca]|uniref:Cyclase n=1 Tax=Echria macrotheca TaxID=438768 RepID=A0AAJ0FHA3_9PEZI|nr:hypothetical protein QBC47DRAFT_16926 [Echria macrotheca]
MEYKLNENGIPRFEDLPLWKSDPMLAAWGLYGDNDQLGTLNRLTDERVAAAAREEIRTGARVSLNWPLNAQAKRTKTPFFNRRAFHHNLYAKPPRTVNDDEWTLNSQGSSQWDGLRHFGYQREKLFYNGVTMEDIHAEGSSVNGIQEWAKKGIVGRAVLVDYHTYRLSLSTSSSPSDLPNPFQTTPITHADLLACLASQNNTPLKFGDILLIRSGFTAAYNTQPSQKLEEYASVVPHHFIGLEQSLDNLRLIWEHCAAVAGDMPTLECWPVPETKGWSLHEVLLAGWGCPIGELFDLEELAGRCRDEKRWSFFLVSEPCHVEGGVASPPNVLAIF